MMHRMRKTRTTLPRCRLTHRATAVARVLAFQRDAEACYCAAQHQCTACRSTGPCIFSEFMKLVIVLLNRCCDLRSVLPDQRSVLPEGGAIVINRTVSRSRSRVIPWRFIVMITPRLTSAGAFNALLSSIGICTCKISVPMKRLPPECSQVTTRCFWGLCINGCSRAS